MVCLSKLSSHTMRSIKCCTRASVWCCISSALEVTLHMHLKHLTDTMSLVLVKFLSKLWCQISYYTLAACGPVWFVRASPPNQITTCHIWCQVCSAFNIAPFNLTSVETSASTAISTTGASQHQRWHRWHGFSCSPHRGGASAALHPPVALGKFGIPLRWYQFVAVRSSKSPQFLEKLPSQNSCLH
jgi:hypothetical protein